MNNIVIRNVEKEDIPQVVDININGWKTAFRGIVDDEYLDNMSKEDKIKKREKDYKENGFIVATINDEVVGFCRYIDNNSRSPEIEDADCELMALYVNIELKNNGIGRKLLEYVKNEFKKKGKTKMVLWCLKDNNAARKFYEKTGGRVVKERDYTIGNKIYKEVAYCYNVKSKKKFADIVNKYKNVIEVEQRIKPINEEDFVGDIYLNNFIEVSEPFLLDNGLCIQDNNYKWLEFYNYSSKVRLTAIYDENNEIIEWYFDIAKEIGKENGIPYEDDMYLDVVLRPNGEIILLDEDELKEALDEQIITKKEFDNAYNVANDLMKKIEGKETELKEFTDRYLKRVLK